MSDGVQRFDADFKKTPGTVSITDGHIYWTPKEVGKMDRQGQSMARVTNMLASKADSKKVSLKLVFKDDLPAGGLLFTFTGFDAVADRSAVQDILIPYVSANRTGGPMPGSAPPTPNPSTPGPSGASGAPSPATQGDRKGKRKAETALDGGGKRPVDYELRRRVLRKNPGLRTLHRDLVLGKQLSEEDFWEGREAMLQAEEMAFAQRPGRQSRLLDDRFDLDSGRKSTTAAGGTGVGIKKQDSGPVVLNLSKELTREIFEEFPVVQDAYARYVPGISEASFWSRYFTSQLWERHRASVRQSAADEVTRKKDDIFDQYLEEPDWSMSITCSADLDQAPRNGVAGDVDRFLDLAATEEDHGDTDVVADHTMQAGRERSSLPLIRRFNEHSNKLLRRDERKSTLSNTVIPDDMDIYNEIDLEDLHGPAQSDAITLDVSGGGEMNGEEGAGTKGVMPGTTPEVLGDILSTQVAQLTAWSPDFAQVSLPNVSQEQREKGLTPDQQRLAERYALQREGSQAAMQVMRDLYDAANLENVTLTPLPDQVLEQMRSCHNAATEFLRQYWSSILPSATGNRTAKAAKAEKMAEYLKTTEGKVNAVIATAKIAGVDPERVRAALAPTVGAAHVALERERKRLIA